MIEKSQKQRQIFFLSKKDQLSATWTTDLKNTIEKGLEPKTEALRDSQVAEGDVPRVVRECECETVIAKGVKGHIDIFVDNRGLRVAPSDA